MSDSEVPKRILIIEDEKAYSQALVLKLQNAGFQAESVADGEEALLAIQKSHFDLLLCDLIMPKVNGFSVLEEIQKQGLSLPVITLSNLGQTEDEKKVREDSWGKDTKIMVLTNSSGIEKVADALETNVFEYLVKSDTTLENLLKKIEEMIG